MSLYLIGAESQPILASQKQGSANELGGAATAAFALAPILGISFILGLTLYIIRSGPKFQHPLIKPIRY